MIRKQSMDEVAQEEMDGILHVLEYASDEQKRRLAELLRPLLLPPDAWQRGDLGVVGRTGEIAPSPECRAMMERLRAAGMPVPPVPTPEDWTRCSKEHGHFRKPDANTCYCGALIYDANNLITLHRAQPPPLLDNLIPTDELRNTPRHYWEAD